MGIFSKKPVEQVEAQQQPTLEEEQTAFVNRLFHPFLDIASLFWIVVAGFTGGAILGVISDFTGGKLDLETKEQGVVSCVVRALNSEELESDKEKLGAIKVCIPKKVEENAKE